MEGLVQVAGENLSRQVAASAGQDSTATGGTSASSSGSRAAAGSLWKMVVGFEEGNI